MHARNNNAAPNAIAYGAAPHLLRRRQLLRKGVVGVLDLQHTRPPAADVGRWTGAPIRVAGLKQCWLLPERRPGAVAVWRGGTIALQWVGDLATWVGRPLLGGRHAAAPPRLTCRRTTLPMPATTRNEPSGSLSAQLMVLLSRLFCAHTRAPVMGQPRVWSKPVLAALPGHLMGQDGTGRDGAARVDRFAQA